MSSRSLIIWLVLALAPAGILVSRKLIPADQNALQEPSSPIAFHHPERIRGSAETFAIRPASAE
jgi:hypothetical protein